MLVPPSRLAAADASYRIYRLDELAAEYDVARLPYTLRILLENVLRAGDEDGVRAVATWDAQAEPTREISFSPSRVLLQDFTGVPAVVDLAAMRDAIAGLGGDPSLINPLIPVELVIDHSVQVDAFASRLAFERNVELELSRNRERYSFLRWGQESFRDFQVVPPGTGICHQVNLEFLARVVEDRDGVAYPDTLVGTDSHTTMVNGLGVLGWGVGGIEAEAAMLGEPLSMLVPQVVGFRLRGRLPDGATATDLVLTVTELLRRTGVVGKLVEYFGDGLEGLTVADRATLGNMSPEYGATCGFFPVDELTLDYLRLTGRSEERIALVEAYCKENLLWHEAGAQPTYSQVVELDLASVEPSLAGPRRPQDRVPLARAKDAFLESLQTFGVDPDDNGAGAETFPASDPTTEQAPGGHAEPEPAAPVATLERRLPQSIRVSLDGEEVDLHHGAVVIAAITSCTNTSNPQVMIGAGLLAKKAVELGLSRKPWVKSSLAPGSRVVTEYYERAGLQQYLDALGFNTVGYGCTTCIGNSGPLRDEISSAISSGDLVACAVLSGNRNFEARIHPEVKANYLASPPLVVAYALAGRMDIDLASEPLATTPAGEDVYLHDLWPTGDEIQDDDRRGRPGRDVPTHLRRRVHRRRGLAEPRGADRQPLPLGSRLDVREAAELPGGRGRRPRRRRRHRRRPLPRLARRLGDDRPHLACRVDPAPVAGRPLPDRARRRAGAVQLLRLTARQPRGDGPRHLRQCAAAQPPRSGLRGDLDRPPALGRGDDGVRGLAALRGRRHPADRPRRQGVRLGLVA